TANPAMTSASSPTRAAATRPIASWRSVGADEPAWALMVGQGSRPTGLTLNPVEGPEWRRDPAPHPPPQHRRAVPRQRPDRQRPPVLRPRGRPRPRRGGPGDRLPPLLPRPGPGRPAAGGHA